MPLGPPGDEDRFDDFEACVDALSEDMPKDDAEAVCNAWESAKSNAMTDHDDPEYRAYHQPAPGDVAYREPDDGDDADGTFAVQLPIASTGEVRNEGDDPLQRDELAGMAEQINAGDVGVFLSHGRSFEISDARFGQTERLGSWRDATLRDDRAEDDPALLEAEAVMADPDTLPDATGRFRETLAILKAQAQRDIPLSSSIGWREDDDAPGGNDLMEASIVGIPADPETNSQGAPAAVARAAVAAGADPGALVEAVRAEVMAPGDGREASDTVTDDDTPSDEQSEDTTDDEQSEQRDAPEWAERMLELQRGIDEALSDLADAVRQEDDEEDDEDDDNVDDDGDDEEEGEENEGDSDDEDEEEEDDEDEQSATPDDEQAAEEVANLREALDTLREGGVDVSDVDLPAADDEQSADADGDGEAHDTTDEDATKALLR